MYGYPYPPPPPPPRPPSGRRWVAWAYVGSILLVIVGVATYVLLNRLDSDILTVIATVGCAAGVALPGLLLALVVLLRRTENRNSVQYPTATQPTLLVVPPMALPPATQAPQAYPASTWETTPPPRRFTVVGDEE